MVAKTLRNTADAYVSSAEPKRTFHNRRKLYVKENNPDSRWAYLYFGVPFSPRSKIELAEFMVYNGTLLEDGADLNVARITEDWSEDTIKWDKRPAAVAGPVVSKVGDIAPDTLWVANITAMLQSVSNGSPFFGLRFTCNDGKGEWFHSSTALNPKLRPAIRIKWSEPTGAPTNLEPSGNRAVATSHPVLGFDWEDLDGETDLLSAKVEFSNSEDFTAITYDTGWYNTITPEVPLASTGYAGLANNASVWWRVSARGADGSESPPSDPVQMKRVDQGVITILNPNATGEVTENTPPIIFDSTVPLVARQVILWDPSDAKRVIWDTGKQQSDDESLYLEKKLRTGRDYGLTINGWDGVQRVRNNGIPPFITAERVFHVEFSDTVAPVTGLQASRVAPWHWTELTWSRATAPDSFEIYANDVLVEKVHADEVIVGASNYEYVVRIAQPRQDTVFKVVAVVNGVGSKNNPTKTTNYKSTSVVLSELDGTHPIMFLNHDYNENDIGGYAIHTVLEGPPIPIMQNVDSGEQFSFTGFLYGEAVPGLTVEEEADRFDKLIKTPGRDLIMTRINKTMEGYIMGGKRKVRADAKGVYYECTFDFYQTDADE